MTLTDSQIESCIDGHSDVNLIRKIMAESMDENELDCDIFARKFADTIKAFISEDENTDEYWEAYNVNYEWGYNIAEQINYLIDSSD